MCYVHSSAALVPIGGSQVDKTHLGLQHECLDREINKDELFQWSALIVIHNIPISVVQRFAFAINNSSGDQEIYCCYDGIEDPSLSLQITPLDIMWTILHFWKETKNIYTRSSVILRIYELWGHRLSWDLPWASSVPQTNSGVAPCIRPVVFLSKFLANVVYFGKTRPMTSSCCLCIPPKIFVNRLMWSLCCLFIPIFFSFSLQSMSYQMKCD